MASAAWERRNAAARAKGYASYYDYRAHDFGKMAPGAPPAKGERLRRLRGHASIGDLERVLRSGRVESINIVQTGDAPLSFDVLAVFSDGTQRRFTLRGEAAVARLRAILDSLPPGDQPGGIRVIGSPKGLKALQQLEAEQQAEIEHEEFLRSGGEEGEEPYVFTDDDIPF